MVRPLIIINQLINQLIEKMRVFNVIHELVNRLSRVIGILHHVSSIVNGRTAGCLNMRHIVPTHGEVLAKTSITSQADCVRT